MKTNKKKALKEGGQVKIERAENVAKDEKQLQSQKKVMNENGQSKQETAPQTQQQQTKKATKKSKKSKKKAQDLTDPAKILEAVLAKSSFKVANLSQIVNRQFYEAEDYKKKLRRDMKGIVYESTVGRTVNDSSDINISVLPNNFDGHINLRPSAIMSLSCINQVPMRRMKFRGKRRNKAWTKATRKQQQEQQKQGQSQKGGGPKVPKTTTTHAMSSTTSAKRNRRDPTPMICCATNGHAAPPRGQ